MNKLVLVLVLFSLLIIARFYPALIGKPLNQRQNTKGKLATMAVKNKKY